MKAISHGRRLVALLVAATLLSACGGREAPVAAEAPGISDTKIHLGGSFPLSGPASAQGVFTGAIKGYFDAVNAAGGVKSADGMTRQIEWTALDDAYEPQRAVTNTRQLVEQEKVFAVFNSLGTANNLATRDYLNQAKVPQAFIFSGADTFYSGYDKHPWTMGWQLPYLAEGQLYANYLKQNMPKASVAILKQNDTFGAAFIDGFKEAISGSGVTIAKEETYEVTDPTVAPQVTNLPATKADVLFVAGLNKPAAQSLQTADSLGWKPKVILTSVASSVKGTLVPAGLDVSTGVITSNYVKDPADPTLANDAAMLQFKQDMAKYCSSCDPDDISMATGYAAAQLMVKAIERMKTPTRQGLMDSIRNLRDIEVPMFLPGVVVNTAPDDGYPVEAAQILRFDGSRYERIGKVIDVHASGR